MIQIPDQWPLKNNHPDTLHFFNSNEVQWSVLMRNSPLSASAVNHHNNSISLKVKVCWNSPVKMRQCRPVISHAVNKVGILLQPMKTSTAESTADNIMLFCSEEKCTFGHFYTVKSHQSAMLSALQDKAF